MRFHSILNRMLNAPRGTIMTYYEGNLWKDRVGPGPLTSDREFWMQIADAMWNMQEAGLVCLVQKRKGPDEYAYIAIRTKKRKGQ